MHAEPEQPTDVIDLDVAVIGGGIAGLWLMNRLSGRGYSCALFEKNRLGGDQTVASQGMIHGGIKYTLSGTLSRASESIADMPVHWSRCLEGEGEVDLREARVLSRHFHFWSSDGLSSRMSTFFASKAVQGRIEKVSRERYPPLLRQPEFHGQVYQLTDIVLDVPSVLRALASNLEGRIFQLPQHQWRRGEGGRAELIIKVDGKRLRVCAQQFVFTAGKGNGDLLTALNLRKPKMQLRPVHQVWVKHNFPYDFFGHCLGPDSTPRISISTHPASDGDRVWSLGGSIAETGARQSKQEVIAAAKGELKQLLPWINLDNAEWTAAYIDRAEARQRNFLRPDKAFAKPAEGIDNVIVGWPTKLTLAPNLANAVLQLLELRKTPRSSENTTQALQVLPSPGLAPPPWETAFGNGNNDE